MSTTIKRTSFSFTKETFKQIEFLRRQFGDNYSQVVKRAIQELYTKIKKEYKNE